MELGFITENQQICQNIEVQMISELEFELNAPGTGSGPMSSYLRQLVFVLVFVTEKNVLN